MCFHDQLEQYLMQLDCTARELGLAAGISPAAMSRYRSGERIPRPEQLQLLAQGIAALAIRSHRPELTADSVLAALLQTLPSQNEAISAVRERLNTLIGVLGIRMNTLAQAINFDTSYLYRICSGDRKPADLRRLSDGVCHFAAEHCAVSSLATLLNCEEAALAAPQERYEALRKWLCFTPPQQVNSMESFLKKLDAFDLEEYIRAVHFDELRVPSVPFQHTVSRSYYGTEEMRRGELDFFKYTVLSKQREPIFMCNDMPMEEMAKDTEFGKKWMYAIALSLKKGLQLHIIHDVNRPLHELLLGLESWIPLYMTGQISPYHLKGYSASVYHHALYVSGAAALYGECLHGCHGNGKYSLTGRKEELAYYRQRAADLLKKAQPLMEIYPVGQEHAFHALMNASRTKPGRRHRIYSSLPLYTIQPSLLSAILSRTGVSKPQSEQLLQHAAEQRDILQTVLEHDTVFDEIPTFTRQELARYPVALSLSGAFFDREILYTYEEYAAHLQQTLVFADAQPNYTLQINAGCTFRNLQIMIIEGDCAMISKSKAPVIHFVLRHPKMLSALENFSVPITERRPQEA